MSDADRKMRDTFAKMPLDALRMIAASKFDGPSAPRIIAGAQSELARRGLAVG